MKRYLLIFIYVFFVNKLSAQDRKHQVGAHWELPTHYGLRYDYSLSSKFSLHANLGLLTEPNSGIIVDVLDAFGTDDEVILMIDNAFQSGVVIKEGINYHFGMNYTGVFLHHLLLTGEDTPYSIIESIFNEDLSSYPSRMLRRQPTENTLTLKSNLLQAGVMYGRIFPFENDTHLFAEISVSLNIASSSTLESEQRDFTTLSEEIDVYLDDIYKSYAYVPSVTLGYAISF